MRAWTISCLVAAGLAACSGSVPCQSCPVVEGVYDVAWLDAGVIAPADGGAAACSAVVPKPATLSLTQSQSRVTTMVADATLGGTLYDTYDLALSGGSGATTYVLRAIVIPTGTSLDGGITLDGRLTVRNTQASGEVCEAGDDFKATRRR